MEIFLLFTMERNECPEFIGAYSDSPDSEVDIGETYCIINTSLNRPVSHRDFDWKVKHADN